MLTLLRRIITKKYEPLSSAEIQILGAIALRKQLQPTELSRLLRRPLGLIRAELNGLERAGYIKSFLIWGVEAGRGLKKYRLTQKGREYSYGSAIKR